jgi:hypothetical protein
MGPPFPGKWTFFKHPWLRAMHESKSEINVGQKAAQLGYTETVLNITFFKIDVEGLDCLYVLPAKTPDAGDFSAARFDPALELSPHLTNLFSDVKNVGHKRAGSANLYIRGSRSRAGLKSIPVSLIVLDEVDEFSQENIPLVFERGSGQRKRDIWMISTPTINNSGINKYYIQSTQEEFYFKCPGCSRYTNLTFPECLEITGDSIFDEKINQSFLKCKECDIKLPHETKPEWLAAGKWIAAECDRDIRGFHINQLYSCTEPCKPQNIAKSYLQSLNDPADEQIFWNDKIGIPHIVKDAQLTDVLINNCKGDYLNGQVNRFSPIVTMGIDVGKWIHYEISAWTLPLYAIGGDINIESVPKTLEIGKLQHFEELDLKMRSYRVMAAVIDANPERRKAYEFAMRFRGHVKMCFYGRGITGKQIHQTKETLDQNEPTITVDRTSWLDLSLGRFRNGSISIPNNVGLEYHEHLKALVRKYEKDKDGNPIGTYIKGSTTEDHYAHARNYCEIALPFAAHISSPSNIRSPI